MTAVKKNHHIVHAIIGLFMTMILLPSVGLAAETEGQADMTALTSLAQKQSYAIGVKLGYAVKQIASGIDMPMLAQGVTDQIEGKEKILSPQELAKVQEAFVMKRMLEHENKRPTGARGTWVSKQESYLLGIDFGKTLHAQAPDVDLKIVQRGIADAYEGKNLLIELAEARQITEKYFEDSRRRKREKVMIENVKKSLDFLQKNKAKNGVQTTKSGLQYEILSTGQGRKPGPGDDVAFGFSATLLDGTAFESNVTTSQKISRLMPGLAEGLQLMHEGSRFRFYIPDRLAFGAKGKKGVPPYSLVIYEVSLIKILR